MEQKDPITIFAKTNFRGREVPFGIKTDDRRRHMYVIGKTGMGKTTLMENMVIQDIRNGHGVAFLDPHGDSVQRILNSVPPNRINDVIYFNPADLDYPVAFNILEAVDSKYKHLVASGLMGVFTKIWANLWSARMEYILNNTILALLDSPGNTLLGITRMYVDKKYRKKIVDNVKDPMVRAFWVDEFANYNEKYRTEAIAPIQNKVGQFLSSGIIRNIVGQPKSTIDLREVMDQQKILIMDLSKGRVGEDNSALLGAMLVTKLQLAAMSRTDIPEAERKDFYLYVDEFQNFATDSFATILSEARKYRLNLIVGHQYIGQLVQERNTKVRDAIFGNVGTLVVFRIGAEDAEFLVKEFEPIFTEVDIVNLPKYSILLKLMINGVASDPFSAITLSPNPAFFTANSEKVIKVSRERFSNPVAEVEEKISRWMGAEYHQEAAVIIGTQQQERPGEQTVVVEAPKVVEIKEPRETIIVEPNQPDKEQVNFEEKNQLKKEEPLSEKVIAKPQQTEQRRKEERRKPDLYENRDSNRQGQNRDRSRFNKPQYQAQQGRHSNSHRQQKKENPIWNRIADLRDQKITEQGQKMAAEMFSSKPKTVEQPKTIEPIEQTVAAHDPSPVPELRKVIKPGESHTI